MAIIADGDLPHGSFALSITGPAEDAVAVVYVAENVRPEAPTDALRRKDKDGKPAGSKYIEGFVTGTASLQLPTTGTAMPLNGATFPADFFKAGGTAPHWVITRVSPQYQHDGLTMCDINFDKRIASSVTVS